MDVIAKIDEYGKPAWIALMILGFIIFWPIGLVILGYLIWSGRMGCSKYGGAGRWWYTDKMRSHRRGGPGNGHRRASSGNHAFDEYKEATLKRLEEEQKEFIDFLERLRQAKDKVEFDQFMRDRKNRPYSDNGNNGNNGGNGDIIDNGEPEAPPAPA